ncbi:hypothetical protein WSM22_47000 [Cytophagales bacterium WSM2-2]|nr:hypothetical protein WSM22_47000 [Cytophagales bacterium WSM2-2]
MSFAISCQDKQNIKVTGQVKDDLTGGPIQNAEVVVLCWYMHNVDDASFKKKIVTTDKSGNFIATFEKGHKIDVATQGIGFLPAKKYTKLESNEINLDFKLKRDKKNETLISYLMTETDFITLADKTPFLRLRTLDNKVTTYGFDFKTLTTKLDTLNCDLWFKIETKPATLVTNKSGGILPIMKSEIKSSLLYEMEQAPTTGYRKSYVINGEEEGFFIKCRDGKTFAKIILTKGTMEISGPVNGSAYKDQGRYFSYFYQPNGSVDLTFSNAKIDLENFLVDYK